MNTQQRYEYEQSLKIYRDMKGVIDTAFDEGVAEGEKKGKIEIAKFMKADGESVEKIRRCTGLSEEKINQL
jgi:predicted transposase/invertase (TIGR01784 family)